MPFAHHLRCVDHRGDGHAPAHVHAVDLTRLDPEDEEGVAAVPVRAEIERDRARADLEPMVGAAQDELERAGNSDTPGVVVADAGDRNQQHIEAVVGRGIQVRAADAGQAKRPAARLGGRPLRVHAPGAGPPSRAAGWTASASG